MQTTMEYPEIKTTDMHTGGEPIRIVESGYPVIPGKTILEKRQYVRNHLDHLRKFLLNEPRGHQDMYGAILVNPDHPEADIAVLFMDNAAYGTMCGHATIGVARYAVDRGFVSNTHPETRVNIQCPCGLVRAVVDCSSGEAGTVRFLTVPAFAFALDVQIEVRGLGSVRVDIGYGGAFYAIVRARDVGCDLRETHIRKLTEVGMLIKDTVNNSVKLHHPDHVDLAFFYGVILTDSHNNNYDEKPTTQLVIFGAGQADRSPCGSGTTARMAVEYKRQLIGLNQSRAFSSILGSVFRGKITDVTSCGELDAILVEIEGKACYTGTCTFTAEANDKFKGGFLM